MINFSLTPDCQEKYDLLIEHINRMGLHPSDAQDLIDLIDDVIDWVGSSRYEFDDR